MFKFQEITLTTKNNIIFLCGTKYRKKSKDDKRNVLQEYIESKFPKIKVIILEEHFVFGNAKGYLSYNEIFMKNLCDIEELSAAFADEIIIIHDSISTGAELAAFASNFLLHSKMCVLEPDSTGVEERKISAFLDLAFFNKDSDIKRIVYYPEVYSYYISKEHIEKRTNFAGNRITTVLAGKIDKFLNECTREVIIKFEKNIYGKVNADPGTIAYGIEKGKVDVNISGQILLYQIIAMVKLDHVKKELRKEKTLYQHIDFMHQEYKSILMQSIQDLTTKNIETIHIVIKENGSKSRSVVGYSMYMMQALDIIEIKKHSMAKATLYKVSIKGNIKKYWNDFSGLLIEKSDALMRLVDE